MTLDVAFTPGEQYTLGDSRLIYLRRVKARVPMWLFQYPSGPLETFTEWQLEDALSPIGGEVPVDLTRRRHGSPERQPVQKNIWQGEENPAT